MVFFAGNVFLVVILFVEPDGACSAVIFVASALQGVLYVLRDVRLILDMCSRHGFEGSQFHVSISSKIALPV